MKNSFKPEQFNLQEQEFQSIKTRIKISQENNQENNQENSFSINQENKKKDVRFMTSVLLQNKIARLWGTHLSIKETLKHSDRLSPLFRQK